MPEYIMFLLTILIIGGGIAIAIVIKQEYFMSPQPRGRQRRGKNRFRRRGKLIKKLQDAVHRLKRRKGRRF